MSTPSEADRRKITISKLDAACRQLNCAIGLWFYDADEVSIHTLAAAAYQIIHDIKQHRGIKEDLLYDSAYVKEEYRKLWIASMKKAQNFFKHADRDPDPEGTIEFSPFGNLLFILMANSGLRLLGVKGSHEVGALFLWLTLHESWTVTDQYLKTFKERSGFDDFEDVKALGKAEFFDRVIGLMRAG